MPANEDQSASTAVHYFSLRCLEGVIIARDRAVLSASGGGIFSRPHLTSLFATPLLLLSGRPHEMPDPTRYYRQSSCVPHTLHPRAAGVPRAGPAFACSFFSPSTLEYPLLLLEL